MFALGIVDKVEPADLTGGLKIAGNRPRSTRTATSASIGRGIDHKMVRPSGTAASVFSGTRRQTALEALDHQVQGPCRLVKVTTLPDALHQLEDAAAPPRDADGLQHDSGQSAASQPPRRLFR